jgi:hypothetical protein
MKEEVAEILFNHGHSIEVMDDYSGRGMYGKMTTAVTCDDMSDICVAIATAAIEEPDAFKGLKPSDFNFREDSLGRGRVYY